MVLYGDYVKLCFIVRLCNLGIIDKEVFESYSIYEHALRGMADFQCKAYDRFFKHYELVEIGLYELFMDLKNNKYKEV